MEASRLGDVIDVPAGQLSMGLTDEQLERYDAMPGFSPAAEAFSDQRPVHPRDVAAFRLTRAPLTNDAYQLFVDGGGYGDLGLFREMVREQGPQTAHVIATRFVDTTGVPGPATWVGGCYPDGRADHPVEGISCYEAMAVVRFLGGRLPSETEWEWAARYPDGRLFAGGNRIDTAQLANVREAGPGTTSAVGSYPASHSALGFVDLAGNVYEWTSSRYAAYPGGVERKHLGASALDRVLRGGAYRDSIYAALTTSRFVLHPGRRFAGLGARVAFDL